MYRLLAFLVAACSASASSGSEITFSTFLGGSGFDAATAIAVDVAGNMYVCGWTESADFPSLGRLGSGGGVDAWVAKIDASGRVIYATVIGGAAEDRALGIAVDSSGAAYVVGRTTSRDFPATAGFPGGGADAFVLKLNPAGDSIVFSRYLGGAGWDAAYSAVVDVSGSVYVTGETGSSNFPVAACFKCSNAGGTDAFVTKINASGSVVYSTYLGGSGDDIARAIAVDPDGAAWITGQTTSLNYPVSGAFQATNAGGQDAFVTHLSPDGATVLYSSYFGGRGGTAGFPEQSHAIAVDSSGAVWIVGATSSPDFPTLRAWNATLRGGGDAFVVKLDHWGGVIFSTFLGGSSSDTANGVAVDADGNGYVTGETLSTDFPLTDAVQTSRSGEWDAFLTVFNSTGTAVSLSTYFGGSGSESSAAVTVDSKRRVHIAGNTLSTSIPLVNPFQRINAGASGGFIATLATAPSCTDVSSINPVVTASTIDVYAYGVTLADSVQFATWSDMNGQDDLIWSHATNLGNGVWKASIDLTQHRPSSPDYGLFYVHSWLFGKTNAFCGGRAFTRVQSPPSCTGVTPPTQVTSALSGTLDLNAYGIQNATSVQFATWSEVNGQDDLVWYPGTNLGGGTWKASVDLARHRPGQPDYGPFNVHVWMFGDTNLICGGSGFTRVVAPAPSCTGVTLPTQVTSALSGTLDLNAYGVQNATSVQFATWSEVNGQDDLVWYPGTNLGGGTWKASVDLARHRPGQPDYGPFNVHVWMFGDTNLICGGSGFTRVVAPAPSCTGVTPPTQVTSALSGTLDFNAYGVQNATSVQFATWSEVNGQDDLVWYPGTNLGGGTWKASVDLARHRPGQPDYGPFNVHVWMFGDTNLICGGSGFTRK